MINKHCDVTSEILDMTKNHSLEEEQEEEQEAKWRKTAQQHQRVFQRSQLVLKGACVAARSGTIRRRLIRGLGEPLGLLFFGGGGSVRTVRGRS